jgi:hypothetical protein
MKALSARFECRVLDWFHERVEVAGLVPVCSGSFVVLAVGRAAAVCGMWTL